MNKRSFAIGVFIFATYFSIPAFADFQHMTRAGFEALIPKSGKIGNCDIRIEDVPEYDRKFSKEYPEYFIYLTHPGTTVTYPDGFKMREIHLSSVPAVIR